MSTFEKISPDDPRLTAFALGEMEAAERAEFEKLLEYDLEARATVAAISGTAHHIGAALANEPMPTYSAAKSDPELSQIEREYAQPSEGMGRMLRFPQLYFTISGLAAACFAVGFFLWQAQQGPKHQYMAVDLTTFPSADEMKAKGAAEAGTENESALLVATGANAGGVGALEKGERDNAFQTVQSAPVSTFPAKTGKAAYANVRRSIEHGRRPLPGAVRIEEMVNYFPYRYAPPDESADGRETDGSNGAPQFAAHLEVANAPWTPTHRLVRIGVKGREPLPQPGESSDGNAIVIAKEVNLQVEFNPAQVQAYRLIGYENRMARKESSSGEGIDAGEIGAGHTVTALYEVVPVGVEWKPEGSVDGLKYQATAITSQANATGFADGEKFAASDEILTLKLRYKAPLDDTSKQLEFPLRDTGHTFEEASADFKFAASVAAFGMILRDSPHKGQATFAKVADWAQAGLVDDAGGYRAEFVGLVGQAGRLAQN